MYPFEHFHFIPVMSKTERKSPAHISPICSINKRCSGCVRLCAASIKEQRDVQVLYESHNYRSTFQDEPYSPEEKPGNTGAECLLCTSWSVLFWRPHSTVTFADWTLVVLCGLISVDVWLLREKKKNERKKGEQTESHLQNTRNSHRLKVLFETTDFLKVQSSTLTVLHEGKNKMTGKVDGLYHAGGWCNLPRTSFTYFTMHETASSRFRRKPWTATCHISHCSHLQEEQPAGCFLGLLVLLHECQMIVMNKPSVVRMGPFSPLFCTQIPS